MNDVYENIDNYNSTKRHNVLMFDEMIADISTETIAQVAT